AAAAVARPAATGRSAITFAADRHVDIAIVAVGADLHIAEEEIALRRHVGAFLPRVDRAGRHDRGATAGSPLCGGQAADREDKNGCNQSSHRVSFGGEWRVVSGERSEEHTSELQSHLNLVCRLLLEKKNT